MSVGFAPRLTVVCSRSRLSLYPVTLLHEAHLSVTTKFCPYNVMAADHHASADCAYQIVTSTTTPIVASYTATAFAICASDSRNYADAVNNAPILHLDNGSNELPYFNTADTTKEGCCASCAALSLCVASAFYRYDAPPQQCSIFTTDAQSCAAPGAGHVRALTSSAYPPDAGILISNGNCVGMRFDSSTQS